MFCSTFKINIVRLAIRSFKNVSIHVQLKRKSRLNNGYHRNPEAFQALQTIMLDKKILEDLPYLTKICHAGVLEVYYSLYNRWAPKRQYFSYAGMSVRSQLAIMDFNEGINYKQAGNENGEKRYNVQFFKVTRSWSSKPIKKKKR